MDLSTDTRTCIRTQITYACYMMKCIGHDSWCIFYVIRRRRRHSCRCCCSLLLLLLVFLDLNKIDSVIDFRFKANQSGNRLTLDQLLSHQLKKKIRTKYEREKKKRR